MPTFTRRSTLPVPARALFDWHARQGAFERLVPPWQHIEVVDKRGTIRDGDVLIMRLRAGPLGLRWVARHEAYEEGVSFTDVQDSGPFAAWRHTHRFHPEGDGHSTLEDHIEYTLPLGPLGQLFGGWIARAQLQQMFTFRHERTMNDVTRHAADGGAPLKVAITGASGVVGTALAAFLTTGGHTVYRLVRRSPDAGNAEVFWSVKDGKIDAQALEGMDAVVHLAGENIGGGRWTQARKQAVIQSREDGTGLLARALAGLKRKPAVLISMSAVGIYGDGGDTPLTEASPPGDLFLSEVCRRWEAAAQPARDAGIRVVHPRLGVVVTPAGGALAQMMLPFKLGLGGPVGSGEQYLPWVALDDVVAALLFLIRADGVEGPVNLTGPNPVRQKAFASTLGAVLGRPAFMPVPAFAVRALFGEMGKELLLAGQRAVPNRLEQLGFSFRYSQLEDALRFELGAR